MFAQVLENSVYTFSIILVVFLIALGLGSSLASAMGRRRLDPGVVLTVALTLAAVCSALVPSAFVAVTSGLQGLGDAQTWSAHVWGIARAAGILLPAGLAAGFVFPYLLRLVPMNAGVGSVLGSLVAVNTAGAIAGSLATGFVMLAWAGLWVTLEAIAIGHLVLGAVAAVGGECARAQQHERNRHRRPKTRRGVSEPDAVECGPRRPLSESRRPLERWFLRMVCIM